MAHIKPLTGGNAMYNRMVVVPFPPGVYYPQYIDPFYKNMLSVRALEEKWGDEIYGGFRIFERGGIRVDTRRSDGTLQIRLGRKSKPLILQGGILRRTGGEILIDKSPFEIRKRGNCLSQERKDDPKPKRLTNRRILIHVEPGESALVFIGSIEPQEGYGYYLPHCYQEGEVTINIGIIYGRVILRTMPEGKFYMACNYNKEGKIIGVCSRTESDGPLKLNEKMGYDYNVPVFHSYYDKDGKGITPKEYDDCLFIIVQQATKLPDVLCGLLGYC